MIQRDHEPMRALRPPDLAWDGGVTPRSIERDDIYYSAEDGLAESRHVFLAGNNLPDAWSGREGVYCVAETGFGTGLNCLLTATAFLEHAPPNLRLHYWSVDSRPLALPDLERALARWPELSVLARELLSQYPSPLPGIHRLSLGQGRVTVDLVWEDACRAVADRAAASAPPVDAWYLDGFAPARNSDMWSDELMRRVAQCSRPGTRFATFTAAGAVRRALAAAGFAVSKRPGYGRKRECLAGELTTQGAGPDVVVTPWDLPASPPVAAPTRAIVIGAGLAGAFAADALARRGVAVTVLEAGQIAGAGSGNPQGVLYARFSHRHSALVDFALMSFLYAARQYRQMFRQERLRPGIDGELCGGLTQDLAPERIAALASEWPMLPELARPCSAEEASSLLGLAPVTGGLWWPQMGWLHPQAVCRALLDHPQIEVREHAPVAALQRAGDGWLVHLQDGTAEPADRVVVAAGTGTKRFQALDWLPLRPIRGQVTGVESAHALASLRAVFCHEGYIAPAIDGMHWIGATFQPGEDANDCRPGDNLHNLSQLASAAPALNPHLNSLEAAALPARAGVRCASPDYLPMAGAVPDRPAFVQTYAALAANARQPVGAAAPTLDGLYCITGLGSRGLTAAPLCAELVASQACAEALPVDRYLARAVAPARFLVREIKRDRA